MYIPGKSNWFVVLFKFSISLMIFSFILSFIDGGILKSPTIIIGSLVIFKFFLEAGRTHYLPLPHQTLPSSQLSQAQQPWWLFQFFIRQRN